MYDNMYDNTNDDNCYYDYNTNTDDKDNDNDNDNDDDTTNSSIINTVNT